MKKILTFIISFILLTFSSGLNVSAQENSTPQLESFYKAKVTAILNFGETITDTGDNPFQELKVKILDGEEKGNEVVIEYGKNSKLTQDQLVVVGETIVVVKTLGPDSQPVYQVADKYRISQIIPIIIFFFLLIIILSGWKGVGSIAGMIISLATIVGYIVPQILKGNDPLITSIIGCFFIMITTIYLAHGFSRRTTIAVVSTFITLIGIGLISTLFVKLTHLTGLGSDNATSLRFGSTSNIDFRGLLLGGILIGALGVLDDVTTGLSASVFEIYKANPKQKFKQLFTSGISVGKEHISSLVNTLVLAYAGASMPIFILIVLNPIHYPLWLILNDGLIMEEVVRTLAGSIGLVAAVPLTTLLATLYVTRTNKSS
jgi:uncharacterized membrane protein